MVVALYIFNAGIFVQADIGMGEQGVNPSGRVQPSAVRPPQAALVDGDACQYTGFCGAHGLIQCAVGLLLCQLLVAALFAGAVVEVQYAASVPAVAFRQR